MRKLLISAITVFAIAACSGASDNADTQAADEGGAMPDPAESTALATPAGEDVEAVDAGEQEPTPAASETPEVTEDEPVAKSTPAEASAPPPKPEPTKVAAAAPSGPPAAWAQCAVCHSINRGGPDGVGPNLFGAYGSKAAQGSYAYSDALKGAGITWNDATLDKWLISPSSVAPGTTMFIPGVKDAAQRKRLIEYMKAQK